MSGDDNVNASTASIHIESSHNNYDGVPSPLQESSTIEASTIFQVDQKDLSKSDTITIVRKRKLENYEQQQTTKTKVSKKKGHGDIKTTTSHKVKTKQNRKLSEKTTNIAGSTTSAIKEWDETVIHTKKPPGPEPDPETSLDVDLEPTGDAANTVHWNPYSSAGQKVGCRVRIFNESTNKWRNGRILRYDPVSHKHKVDFTSEKLSKKYVIQGQTRPSHCEWIDLKNFSVYLSGRFVWALVKGFAWWPAQVLTYEQPINSIHSKLGSTTDLVAATGQRDLFSEPPRDGYLLVEFFDSGEVAFIKDSSESIRPFRHGRMDDPIMKKNKKRPSAASIEQCKKEEDSVQRTRKEAVEFYARKAFAYVDKAANYLLGRKVQFFRGDLNYPNGEHVTGTVRQYSPACKKWLVAFDPWPSNKAQYAPGWFNLMAKDSHLKFVDQLKPVHAKNLYQPTDSDLSSFMFGYELDSRVHDAFTPVCCGCHLSITAVSQIAVLNCLICFAHYHRCCIDPTIVVQSSDDSAGEWICTKCSPCIGCKQHDIAFGLKTVTSSCPSLNLKVDESLNLCTSCIPLYDKNMFCPVCTHVWDDVKFQKVQARLLYEAKMKNPKILGLDFHEFDVGVKPKVEWYFPETLVWGYNESTMIQCDMCNLWVHAGCASLSRNDYQTTIEGTHPVYSKEFLCRVCCKKRCHAIMDTLEKDDVKYLFATPVTEQMAHNYHDIIKNPMDLMTMREMVETGNYHNYAWIRESFELMVYNALTYNRAFTPLWNEARRFHDSCIKKVFNTIGKASPPSPFQQRIQACIKDAYNAIQAEVDRERMDATAEKKDAVAGAQLVSVRIEKLVNPVDPNSCIYFTENLLSSVDAFFSCWMECCFICGSSGCMDTLLYCVDCGEAFHSFCANAPIQSMTSASLLSWRCQNCKVCEISGNVPTDDSKLIICEMCDRAFSIDLINPTLSGAPKGLWICAFCVDCRYCNNKSGTIDRTMWSMHPDVCYRCGGAVDGDDGQLKKYMCSVCGTYSLPTDSDLKFCGRCNHFVHRICIDEKDDLEENGKFCCKPCHEGYPPFVHDRSVSLSKQRTPSDRCLDINQMFSLFRLPDDFDELQLIPSQWALEMISYFRSREIEHDATVLDIDKHSEWWSRKRLYYRRSLLEDAVTLYQSVRTQFNIKFQLILSSQLEKDQSSLWTEAFGKAARFFRLLRLHEKRWDHLKSSDVNLSSKKSMDQYYSVLTDMACSFTCVTCNLFGLNVSHFFPESMGTSIDPEIHAEVAGSHLSTTKENISSAFDIHQIALEIASLNPIDEAIETDELSNAAFQSSHQPGTETSQLPQSVQCVVAVHEENNFENMSESQQSISIQAFRKIFETNSSMFSVSKLKLDETVIRTQPSSIYKKRRVQLEAPSAPFLEWRSSTALQVKPMIGWGSSVSEAGNNPCEWKDPRLCCLCMTCGDDDADSVMPHTVEGYTLKRAGRLLPCQGSWVHAECALWSSEVWKDTQTGTIYDVHKARSRASKLKCHGCGRLGATVGCNKMHCKSNYHFACAAACGALFTSSCKVFCLKHKDVSNDPPYDNFNEIMEFLKIDRSDTIESGISCLRVGALVVHSFGVIDQDSDAFYNRNYMFPEGFTTSRIFWSSVTPMTRTLYIMSVSSSTSGRPVFSIRAADSRDAYYESASVKKIYDDLIERVLNINQDYFSSGALDSIRPVFRSTKRKVYGLNGPQFFGFGLESVRKVLERMNGSCSCAVPLSEKSEPYRFCFVQIKEDELISIQRKRALTTAEKSLQNPSGCARAEGASAFHKSVGSGRITRALVRKADEEIIIPGQSNGVNNSQQQPTSDDYNKKYLDMKSVPFDQKLIAKRSHIHGWGLFTKISYKKDSMIVEYMGEVIRQCTADSREREYEELGIGSCYMFRIDSERIVDATTVGSMARFMNHSCSSNSYAKVVNITDESGASDKKIVVFASKDIAVGEEITYDYKFPVEDGSLRCSCGAPNCIGRMN